MKPLLKLQQKGTVVSVDFWLEIKGKQGRLCLTIKEDLGIILEL